MLSHSALSKSNLHLAGSSTSTKRETLFPITTNFGIAFASVITGGVGSYCKNNCSGGLIISSVSKHLTAITISDSPSPNCKPGG